MKITYMKMFLTYKIFIEILKLGFFSITLDNSLKNKRNTQTNKKKNTRENCIAERVESSALKCKKEVHFSH